jgi:hypothetical protein
MVSAWQVIVSGKLAENSNRVLGGKYIAHSAFDVLYPSYLLGVALSWSASRSCHFFANINKFRCSLPQAYLLSFKAIEAWRNHNFVVSVPFVKYLIHMTRSPLI